MKKPIGYLEGMLDYLTNCLKYNKNTDKKRDELIEMIIELSGDIRECELDEKAEQQIHN